MKIAWKGYETYAWGKDELRPISKTGTDWFGLGLTIIDTLDTAYIMGEKDIYLKCRNWVDKNFTVQSSSSASFFETTIRILGGFLSTYDLTRDSLFLTKATEMGDTLLKGIHPTSKIPYPYVNFRAGHGSGGSISLAEIGTLQMEFKYLSYLTKDPKYWNAVQTISKLIFDQKSKEGLVAKQWGVANFNVIEPGISIGSGGDSYYE